MFIKNTLKNEDNKRFKFRILIIAISVAIIVCGVALLPYVISFYFSPKRLIRNTTEALEKFTGAKIKIERAQLSINGKIIFYNVSVFVPHQKMINEPMFQSSDAKLFDAKKLEIHLKRRGILSLKFSLKSINVINPKFHLTKIKGQQKHKDKWNWEMLFYGTTSAERARKRQRRFGVGPKITLQDGQIELIEITTEHRLFMGQINFTANAIPMKHFYRIKFKTWTTENKEGPVAFIDFDPRNGKILAGKMESISWKNLELTLPHPYRDFCKQYNLSGKIGIQMIKYESAGQSQVILVMENVQACLPLSRAIGKGNDNKVCQKFFRLSELNGKLVFSNKEVLLDDIQGKLNGAKCTITGTYEGYSNDPSKIAFNIRIKTQDFICPDYTDPRQYPIIEYQFPWKLRCFFHDFKPKGKVDFDIEISKQKGKNNNFVLNGNVDLKHISAEYFKFPYRVDNIIGKIAIENNSFKLIGLKAKSDNGKITLDGFISEPSKFSAVDIEIHTKNTPLNNKLFRALPEHYQKVWKMFNPQGYGDSDIVLHRPAGTNRKWKRKIKLKLTKASGCYEKFRYPIHNLRGVMYVEDNKLYLKDLQGHDKQAILRISGIVENINTNKPVVKVNISARNVPIDETLINALPIQAGNLIKNCQLTGITDFTGNLFSNVTTNKSHVISHSKLKSSLQYQFKCKLKGIQICYKDFPYPIKNLEGTLTITPEKVIIDGVFARKGNQQLQAKGNLILGKKNQQITLKILADNIPVDSQLYQALSASQKKIWNTLEPTGKIKMEADLKRIEGQEWKWKIIITPKNCQIKYNKFPTITDLTGTITFYPDTIIFNEITGTINKHPVSLNGQLKSRKGTLSSTLTLTIEKMPITSRFLSLFDANVITNRLKWTPGGTLKCRLRELIIERYPDGQQHWKMNGKFSLKEVNIKTFAAKPVNCNFVGQLEWQKEQNNFAMEGRLSLDKFEWNNKIIENLKCVISKQIGSTMLHIKKLRGQFGGGEISGLAELQLSDRKSDYGIQITLNNISASKAFSLAPKNNNNSIQGKIRGQIYLLGTTGQKHLKRGGGTLEITGAQVLKIPLMKKVYESVQQNPPNLASFHNIILRFTIEQYILKFQRITLTGPTLSLIGNGRINLSNDRIKLYLISAPPETFNKFPILKELLQGAASELTEIEVHGTIDKPIINAQPLKNISDTIKAFSQGQ